MASVLDGWLNRARSVSCLPRVLVTTAMRYGLKCPVTSNIKLASPVQTRWDDLDLTPNAEGFFAQLSVSIGG